MSVVDFYNDPTWANAGWLALDTIGLLPIIPGGGTARRGLSALGGGDNAVRAAGRADALPSCAFNSFTGSTMVHTKAGLLPIETVKVGDKVYAMDPETGEAGFFDVVYVTSHPTDELLRITIDGEVMEVTPEHPIYVEGKGWLKAEDLTIGDRLRRADGGWTKVLAIERVVLDTPQMVYNFTVKGIHTYFVLEMGVLVHNCFEDLVDVAKVEADSALATPLGIRRPRAAGGLEVDGHIFSARSVRGKHPPRLRPEVQEALDDIPQHLRSRSHGRCVEPQCISQALDAGLDPRGGTSLVLKVGGKAHRLPIPACSSCEQLLAKFGIRDGAIDLYRQLLE